MMVCEGKYAYEGLTLGIWKLIWVIMNVKGRIWEKNYFWICKDGIFGQKMAILG